MSQLKKTALALLSVVSVSFASADEIVTRYAEHNGITYTYSSSDSQPLVINICDGESVAFSATSNQSGLYYNIYGVESTVIPVCPSNSNNAGRDVLDNYTSNANNLVTAVSFQFDNTTGSNNYQEHYIRIRQNPTYGSPASTTCIDETVTYIVRVYPSLSASATYSYSLDANGIPTTLQSNYTDEGVNHSWEYAYVSDPTNFNTIYLANGANPAIADTLSITSLWNYGAVFKNKCVIIRHTVSSPCLNSTYETEMCFDACDVSAVFTANVNYVTMGGLASVTLMTDEDVNNPTLSSFQGSWIVKENGVVTTNYPVDANNNVIIPANVNFEFCYFVYGYTSEGPNGPECYDEFCVDVNIKHVGDIDCRRLQLASATIFEQISIPGNPNEALVIYPQVQYLLNGSMVSSSLTPSSIMFVTINGVAMPLSILNTVGNHATINGLNFGDKVCITIEFKGCLVEHCYEVVKGKDDRPCDISMLVNMPVDGIKYPCKRVFVATGADAINGNMVWKVNGAVQTGQVGTSFTYTVGAATQVCVGTQKCSDVCVIESCRRGDRRLAQPNETIEISFNTYNELIFEGHGAVSNIVLYNVQGQEVYRLSDFELQGEEVRQFDYKESGIFFLRFEVEGKVQSRKIVLN